MNERLNTSTFETNDRLADIDTGRSLGRNAIQTLSREAELLEQPTIDNSTTNETIRRPDSGIYAQDQDIYKPFVGKATEIIMQAFIGDLSALDQIPDATIREALRERILLGNNEIDKMISVACGAFVSIDK
ncbi:MAG: hypothetical protein JWN75_964 [Candidatus Saccharibacteria bacterium]|nr:hypothetical protein [Candidatus Saccharibacteria bacterium]